MIWASDRIYGGMRLGVELCTSDTKTKFWCNMKGLVRNWSDLWMLASEIFSLIYLFTFKAAPFHHSEMEAEKKNLKVSFFRITGRNLPISCQFDHQA